MRFCLLFITLLVACCWPAPKRINLYFWATLINASVLEVPILLNATYSHLYAILFILMELYLFGFMFNLTWNSIRRVQLPKSRLLLLFITLNIAIIFTGWAAKGKLDANNYISLGDGLLTLWCAISVGVGAAYMKRWGKCIAYTLATEWGLQSLFDYGFSIHLYQPKWMWLNNWLPTIILVAGVMALLGELHFYAKDEDVSLMSIRESNLGSGG